MSSVDVVGCQLAPLHLFVVQVSRNVGRVIVDSLLACTGSVWLLHSLAA